MGGQDGQKTPASTQICTRCCISWDAARSMSLTETLQQTNGGAYSEHAFELKRGPEASGTEQGLSLLQRGLEECCRWGVVGVVVGLAYIIRH
jgi:hypothetical protein